MWLVNCFSLRHAFIFKLNEWNWISLFHRLKKKIHLSVFVLVFMSLSYIENVLRKCTEGLEGLKVYFVVYGNKVVESQQFNVADIWHLMPLCLQ